MPDGLQHIRYAFRSLSRRPGYTIAAVLTIALGIAATTSVFSVASGVLFTALPYQDARQLVRVAETYWKRS